MRRQLKDRTETLQVSQSATEPYRARSRKSEDQRVFRVFGENGAATVPIKPSDERSPNLFDPAKTYEQLRGIDFFAINDRSAPLVVNIQSLSEVTDTIVMELLIIRINFRLAEIEYLLDSFEGAGSVDGAGRRKSMRSKSLVARKNTKRRSRRLGLPCRHIRLVATSI